MIYVFAEDPDAGPVKIGYTKGHPFEGDWMQALMHRLRDAQLGNPRQLYVIALCGGTAAEERAVHALFRVDRIRNEWFERSAQVAAFVDAHRVDAIANRYTARTGVKPASERTDEYVLKAITSAWGRTAARVARNQNRNHLWGTGAACEKCGKPGHMAIGCKRRIQAAENPTQVPRVG